MPLKQNCYARILGRQYGHSAGRPCYHVTLRDTLIIHISSSITLHEIPALFERFYKTDRIYVEHSKLDESLWVVRRARKHIEEKK